MYPPQAMPYVPRQLPAGRFFARLDRFECECPSCGKLILPYVRRHKLPARLQDIAAQRSAAKQLPDNPSVKRLIFNPHTQQLRCPHCQAAYVAGLLLFPVGRTRRLVDAPLDATPTTQQRLALAHAAGGFFEDELYEEGTTQVNRVVTGGCSCPPRAWDHACPVHGIEPAS